MARNDKKVPSIKDIRFYLVGVVKDWNQQTSDLSWPEDDDSMADMDGHIFTLRAISAQLALVENKLPPEKQKSVAAHFDRDSVHDAGKFAPFAAAVRTAIAA